jgi:hypothetical protein
MKKKLQGLVRKDVLQLRKPLLSQVQLLLDQAPLVHQEVGPVLLELLG